MLVFSQRGSYFSYFFLKTLIVGTVNQLILAAISFHVFVFMGTLAAIYFHGLQNCFVQDQCTGCLYMDNFVAIHFSKFFFLVKIAKINRSRK